MKATWNRGYVSDLTLLLRKGEVGRNSKLNAAIHEHDAACSAYQAKPLFSRLFASNPETAHPLHMTPLERMVHARRAGLEEVQDLLHKVRAALDMKAAEVILEDSEMALVRQLMQETST